MISILAASLLLMCYVLPRTMVHYLFHCSGCISAWLRSSPCYLEAIAMWEISPHSELPTCCLVYQITVLATRKNQCVLNDGACFSIIHEQKSYFLGDFCLLNVSPLYYKHEMLSSQAIIANTLKS